MAFIDTRERPAGEVQQKLGRLKLSEAVRECGYGSAESLQECVLGRAYTRLTGRSLLDDTYDSERHKYRWLPIAAEAFNVPVGAAVKAEKMCYDGKFPAEIADWLATQGL